MEIEVTKSSVVVVRTLSSAKLTVSLFIGGTYPELLKQIEIFVGKKEKPFPYWAHGIHVCDNYRWVHMKYFLSDYFLVFPSKALKP